MSEFSIGLTLDNQKEFLKTRSLPGNNHRVRMAVITFLSDFVALLLTTFIIDLTIYQTAWFDFIVLSEIEHILFMSICLSLFMSTKLYPGIGLNPAYEMKAVIQLTMVSFLIVFSFQTINSPQWGQEKLALILMPMISIVAILSVRWAGRILTVQLGLWGEPVVLIASKENLESLVLFFHQRRRLGFLPVLGVTEENSPITTEIPTMGLSRFLDLQNQYFSKNGIHTAMVGTLVTSDLAKLNTKQALVRKFKRLIFISDMDWLEGASITYHDLEGMLGMEAQQNFLTPMTVFLKRATDIFISTVLGILSLPIVLIISLLIRLDSLGPVIYTQERFGKDRRKIRIYKFRSMYVNADDVLEKYLKQNPRAREEWERTQKLREDPRITRVGKWIRKLSIDEIPQLFNIFKGDMSVVGPRPILLEQEKMYGGEIGVYFSVRPGLTGFWQVSGRNRTSFLQRVSYDVYYVHNWSVWLDTYILLRTAWVVLTRDGAY